VLDGSAPSTWSASQQEWRQVVASLPQTDMAEQRQALLIRAMSEHDEDELRRFARLWALFGEEATPMRQGENVADWAKIDVGFLRHPQVVGMKPADQLGYLALILYSMEYETDGEIPAAALPVVSGEHPPGRGDAARRPCESDDRRLAHRRLHAQAAHPRAARARA
jgi:hypothetical protein